MNSKSTNAKDTSYRPTALSVTLLALRSIYPGLNHIPSKKNYHFPGKGGRILIDKPIKARMLALENAILSELYSESQIIENETHSECLKRLRTLLSGLSDDSIREIPKGQWETERTIKGSEGVIIEITQIN